MDSRTEKLRTRTKDFAVRIIHLFQTLPTTKEAQVIGTQLLRCGTSIGANYRSACHARSRADFISKIGIVAEEADESVFWIELLSDLKIVKNERLADLLKSLLQFSPPLVRLQNNADDFQFGFFGNFGISGN